MTEAERNIISALVDVARALSSPDREALLAFGEGMAFKGEQQRSERAS